MYGDRPDVVHAIVVTYAGIILHDLTGQSIQVSTRNAIELIQSQMQDVYKSNCVVPCLADESFPDRSPSFSTFSRNCERFVELLQSRIGTPP